MSVLLFDAAGRRRSPATLPGYRRESVPRNKGRRYPATRHGSRRSSPSCGPPETASTASASVP
jgi:hypothetical protein